MIILRRVGKFLLFTSMTSFSAHQNEVSCNNFGGAVADMIKALAPFVEIATEAVQVPPTALKTDIIGRPLHIRRPNDPQKWENSECQKPELGLYKN